MFLFISTYIKCKSGINYKLLNGEQSARARQHEGKDNNNVCVKRKGKVMFRRRIKTLEGRRAGEKCEGGTPKKKGKREKKRERECEQ